MFIRQLETKLLINLGIMDFFYLRDTYVNVDEKMFRFVVDAVVCLSDIPLPRTEGSFFPLLRK